MSLGIQMQPQPDDVTCGPTCLQAVYSYYGVHEDVPTINDRVHKLDEGGTFGVCLGIDALQQGFHAVLYSFNLELFDPTWFHLDSSALRQKLAEQAEYKTGARFSMLSKNYDKFIAMGGQVHFADLSAELLQHYFAQKLPIITGLSATYLYQSVRERETQSGKIIFDDVRGKPMGHFVTLDSMQENQVFVADPYPENPYATLNYQVPVQRLCNAILLGDKTYDANLLILSPHPISIT